MTAPALVILAEVFVPGHPKTKGSLEFVTKTHVRESVTGSDRWRKLVAGQLRAGAIKNYQSDKVVTYLDRVGVRIVSYVQPATGTEGWLDKAKAWVVSRMSGDVDKQARNVLDALTDSGIIADDAQVWDLMASKRLALPGMPPGQQIQVWVIPDGAPW